MGNRGQFIDRVAATARDLCMAAFRQRESEQAKAQARREIAASVIEKQYPKVAAKLRAGMRYSTWSEDLIDPGYLLDLLEKLEA